MNLQIHGKVVANKLALKNIKDLEMDKKLNKRMIKYDDEIQSYWCLVRH